MISTILTRHLKLIFLFIFIIVTLQISFKIFRTDHPDVVNLNKQSKQVNYTKPKTLIHKPFEKDSKFFKLEANLFREDDYLNEISVQRINKLLQVLKEKEAVYKDIFKDFDLVSFSDFINKNEISSEFNEFIELKNNNVVASDYFVNYLKTISHIQTERNNKNRDISTHHELAKVFIFQFMTLI